MDKWSPELKRPISSSEMKQYKARKLTPGELAEFELRLAEAGMESDTSRPRPAAILSFFQAEGYEEPFDTETLVAYLKGELESRERRAIEQLRSIDPDLDSTMKLMESAKREVDASIALGSFAATSPPERERRHWFSITGLVGGLACLAALTLLVFRISELRTANGAVAQVERVLQPSAQSALSPEATAALERGTVKVSADARQRLETLASNGPTTVQMSPTNCLYLPTSTTTLAWDGIKADRVRCQLSDAGGAKLGEAVVMQGNSWTYKKPLGSGEFSWTVEWVNAKGESKSATRTFQVVDDATALAMTQKLLSAGDSVTRAVILAENGYTSQSLGIIDTLIEAGPPIAGLSKLRDSIAGTATSV